MEGQSLYAVAALSRKVIGVRGGVFGRKCFSKSIIIYGRKAKKEQYNQITKNMMIIVRIYSFKVCFNFINMMKLIKYAYEEEGF